MVRLNLLSLAATVLSRPADLIDRSEDPLSAGRLAGPLVLLVALGGALFGGMVGSFHGGWQVPLAALKMPVVLLAPVVVTLPALRALHEEPVSLQRAGLAALVGTARIAVLSTALLPLLWLAFSLGVGYRAALFLMAGGLVVVGLHGLATVGRALSPGGRWRAGPVLATVLLVGVVIAQTGRLLRPFVVTPGARLTVLCPVTEDVFAGLLARVDGSMAAGPNPWDCAEAP